MANKITVVIPTHNRNSDLKKAVDSILAQTKLPNELVVIDDGSTPPVTNDIFSHASDEITCRLIRNEVPKGANHARNLGVKSAQGSFIAFLDDDDEFKEDKIEMLVDAIDKNTDADVFYHPAEIHMVKEGIVYISKPKNFKPDEDIFRTLLISNRIGGTPMVTVRKAALIDIGIFDEQMPALQDYELWLRLAKAGYKFKLIDRPLTKYHYVTSRSSISKSIAVSLKAIDLIEQKYSLEYSNLSDLEKKQYAEWKNKKLIHKSLLNGQAFKAFQLQVAQFFSSPSLKHLLAVFAIMLGPKFVYKIKAVAGRF